MILVTGGLGYIGSHIVISLTDHVIVLDNLSNSYQSRYDEILKYKTNVELVIGDYTNKNTIDEIFQTVFHHDVLHRDERSNTINTVIHLAALKSVSESVLYPELYNQHNHEASKQLIDSCIQHSVKYFIFSSSACVYKPGDKLFVETDDLNPSNPYGWSKVHTEKYLESVSDKIKYISFRYFNPIGGLFVDTSPSNVIPKLLESMKQKTIFNIYGEYYNTRDGTAIRDYINVLDIATAHNDALKYLSNNNIDDKYQSVFNLGSEHGTSVKELIDAFNKCLEAKNKKMIDYKFVEPRVGDVPMLVAKCDLVRELMEWYPKYNLEDSCNQIIDLVD